MRALLVSFDQEEIEHVQAMCGWSFLKMQPWQKKPPMALSYEKKSVAEIGVAAIRHSHCSVCATKRFNAGNRGSAGNRGRAGTLRGRRLLEGALHAGLPWH